MCLPLQVGTNQWQCDSSSEPRVRGEGAAGCAQSRRRSRNHTSHQWRLTRLLYIGGRRRREEGEELEEVEERGVSRNFLVRGEVKREMKKLICVSRF